MKSSSGMPVEYGRALLASLSRPEDRLAAWKLVFAEFKSTHRLSPNQFRSVSDAESSLRADLFVVPITQRASMYFSKVRMDLRMSLGEQFANDLLRPFGHGTDGLPMRERFVTWFDRVRIGSTASRVLASLAPVVRADFDPEASCSCNPELADNDPPIDPNDDCHYHTVCKTTDWEDPKICKWTSWGCGGGFPYLWDCKSVCYYPDPEG